MKKSVLAVLALPLVILAAVAFAAQAEKKQVVYPLGYDDTPPIFPGSKWKVHDIARPAPPAVKPGDKPGAAPADAIILFDGKGTDTLVAKEGKPCFWKIENGELIVDGGDSWTKQVFGSCQLAKGNVRAEGVTRIWLRSRTGVTMTSAVGAVAPQ